MAGAPLMELSRPISGLSDVFAGLDTYLEKFEAGVEEAADAIAAALESYAKTHHLWIPRTGHTTNSTRATVFMRTREYAMIALSAGMDYDVMLELARQGKWAWLYPAVMDMSTEIGRIVAQKVRAQ